MALYEVPAVEMLPFYHDGTTEPEDAREPISLRMDGGENESHPNGDGDEASSSSSSTDTEIDGDERSSSESESNKSSTNNAVGETDNAKDTTNNGYSSLVVPIESLPPLPEPEHDILRGETRMGTCLVIVCSIVLPLLTQFVAFAWILPTPEGDEYATATKVFLSLVYAQAVVALICLVGILKADPCTVRRSPETCFPMPLAVESWIMEGDQGSEQQTRRPPRLNRYIKGSDPSKGVYCTKCLVWRKPGKRYYHCAYCQRCSANHDHHCNFFGRCIAGKLKFWEKADDDDGKAMGNILFFYAVIATGGWAYFTVVSAFLYVLSMRYGVKYVVPIGLTVMLFLSCCCCNNGPLRTVCWPILRLIRMAMKLIRWCLQKRGCSSTSSARKHARG